MANSWKLIFWSLGVFHYSQSNIVKPVSVFHYSWSYMVEPPQFYRPHIAGWCVIHGASDIGPQCATTENQTRMKPAIDFDGKTDLSHNGYHWLSRSC